MIRLLTVVPLLLAFSLSFAAPATLDKSRKMELPNSISDSLPWFAIRDFTEARAPWTRSHLANLAKKSNRTALVYFATWCIPCRAGIKRLVESAEDLHKNKVSVVLVNIGERDEDLVKSWIKKMNVSKFMVVNDSFKRLTEGFGLVKEGEEISLPRTIVFDNNLKPLFMLGEEGRDWPQILWTK